MAKMIPDVPRDFDPKSREGVMFEGLNKLPEDYYVFHSFSIVTVKDNALRESETDFVIFHPKKGIICLEAKAGQADYYAGCWRYADGKPMPKGGPYRQAESNKINLIDYMRKCGLDNELNNCKMLHAVWFPSVPMSELKKKNLPSESDLRLTLSKDAFNDIKQAVDDVFLVDVYRDQKDKTSVIKNNLTEINVKNILEKVLAPTFHIISLQAAETARKEQVFKRMQDEQIALLNYLEEQNSAVINGLAGTGKTVMAVTKALRHAAKNEKVLFLCYNRYLNEYLRKTYQDQKKDGSSRQFDYKRNVSYYTIDGFACKVCGTDTHDYKLLHDKLEALYCDEEFEYQHVIIDEGQDFGKEGLEEAGIIEDLKTNALGNKNGPGSFYMFYDKNQLIQAETTPKFIEEADCRLTLYRNCRNTQNIAATSLKLLGSGKDPILIGDAIKGEKAEIGFCADAAETAALLNDMIDKYKAAGYESIAVLTCKTEQDSILADYCQDSLYKGKKGVKFTTCRKFKGLEADAVIVIDIDKAAFDDPVGELLMYAGTSRAKYRLCCLINMSEEECRQVLQERRERRPEKERDKEEPDLKRVRNIYAFFAKELNGELVTKAQRR